VKPLSPAYFACSLAASLPKSVFSASVATDVIFRCLEASTSFMNSNALRTNSSSCGVVRKKYLKPRAVSVGEDDSALRKGIL